MRQNQKVAIMRRAILTFLLALTVVSAAAYTVLDTRTGKLCESTVAPGFKKSVEQLQNGIKVTYTLDSVAIHQDNTVAGTSYFTIDGLPLSFTECEAWVPYASDQFLVPDSSKCTLQILEDDYLDYEVSLSPARRKPIDNDDNPEVDLKPIRLADRYVPSVLSDAPEMFSYRGAQIVNLCAKPIQYNSARKTARIHRKISVLVDYGENETVPEMPETCKHDPVLKGMLTSVDASTNSMMRESYSGKPFFEEKSDYYLIITTDDLIIPASRLSEWRNCTGYETRIVTQRKWTKEQVKSAVRSFYNTYYPNA